MTHQNPGETLWRGAQWSVTTFGLETHGEPYHYPMSAEQIAAIRPESNVLNAMIHMMEKTWLEVDDFLTAYLTALALHGCDIDAAVVRESVAKALAQRGRIFSARPGQIEKPKGASVSDLSEIGRYIPRPEWKGTRVIGQVLGGRKDPPGPPAEHPDG